MKVQKYNLYLSNRFKLYFLNLKYRLKIVSLRRIMKRYLLCIFVACMPLVLWGQVVDTNLDPNYLATMDESDPFPNEDSIYVNSSHIDPQPFQWKVDERFGTVLAVPMDTLFINFPATNLNDGMTGHYSHLGNLGTPRLSRVWRDRKPYSQMYFLDPYHFYKSPGDFHFTNSRLPYTNATYYKAGSKADAEEHLNFYFSRNAGKDFAVGFNLRYLYSLGFYQNQNNSQFNPSFFLSYLGERYQAKFLYQYYYLKLAENGGITDDRYITDPEAMAQGTRQFSAREIPVLFDYSGPSAWNRNRLHDVFYTHSYNVGFHREEEIRTETDTTLVREYIPVSSFIHTMHFRSNKHRFNSNYDLSRNDTNFYYPNTYLRNDSMSVDSTLFTSFKNTIAVSLLEGFNKYAKAGVRAFMDYEFRQVSLMPRDNTYNHMEEYTEHEVFVGGQLTKTQGNVLHYDVIGSLGLLGKAIGQFDVKGKVDLNFKLWNDTVSLVARGGVSNLLPSFYMRHYHSNHYRWDNDNIDKEFRTRVEGELSINRWRTRVHGGVENIKNYAYLNSNAIATQESSNIQVLSLALNQDFKWGILHLDNEVIWQESTGSVLPLPALSLYHNLYIDTYMAKGVLRMQLGADVRYFTEYEAPAYNPAIGQYHLQNSANAVKIGNYPVVNAYINFVLKDTRFFLMAYHLNQGIGKYFTVPHYPINPFMIKFGLSWNFFD